MENTTALHVTVSMDFCIIADESTIRANAVTAVNLVNNEMFMLINRSFLSRSIDAMFSGEAKIMVHENMAPGNPLCLACAQHYGDQECFKVKHIDNDLHLQEDSHLEAAYEDRCASDIE